MAGFTHNLLIDVNVNWSVYLDCYIYQFYVSQVTYVNGIMFIKSDMLSCQIFSFPFFCLGIL